MASSDTIVGLLKAAGEETRLRLIALLAQGELSVKDFTEILGQSQPRISRHLKLLADVGLVTRHAEGAWAYYRLADSGTPAALGAWATAQLDPDSPVLMRDRERFEQVRAGQRQRAADFFAKIAPSWDRLRTLHVPDAAVEQAILDAVGSERIGYLLDVGTGTGRMLEVLAGRFDQGLGIDSSREMLSIARAKLDAAQVANAQVRLVDIADLGEYHDMADLAVIHQVLHYFDDPGFALASVRRCLRKDGTILVVDFAPHTLEFLREEQAHRRLGLSESQVESWAAACGLKVEHLEKFAPRLDDGLTVCLWVLGPATADERTREA